MWLYENIMMSLFLEAAARMYFSGWLIDLPQAK